MNGVATRYLSNKLPTDSLKPTVPIYVSITCVFCINSSDLTVSSLLDAVSINCYDLLHPRWGNHNLDYPSVPPLQ